MLRLNYYKKIYCKEIRFMFSSSVDCRIKYIFDEREFYFLLLLLLIELCTYRFVFGNSGKCNFFFVAIFFINYRLEKYVVWWVERVIVTVIINHMSNVGCLTFCKRRTGHEVVNQLALFFYTGRTNYENSCAFLLE